MRYSHANRRKGRHAEVFTVRIHVGQTGTAADPVQREFTGELRGLTSIGLSADVTLQADDDIATMEVIGHERETQEGIAEGSSSSEHEEEPDQSATAVQPFADVDASHTQGNAIA
ncbi:hypothetical protein AUJ46_05670 [Candidatus Peregrinibacteria bacterium CG1_02_54_53]|nr:MAG: hypothetical protein AUJ46_05670 [Candidatus Peregrinibacteria bacterium CG1_02_54_53]